MSPGTDRRVEDGMTLRLHGNPEAAAHARQALTRLRSDIDSPLMETLRLLVTELVTNSVTHARADSVILKVLVGNKAVWTEVTDEGPGFDPGDGEWQGEERAERAGWGLFLVERLANRWGVNHEGPSTKVWFELLRS
jgi:anti-sigma regulatory factor (Ser/Thr protein kinase)